MSLEISCPVCGESEELSGTRNGEQIDLRCESCGQRWARATSPTCPRCRGVDLAEVPHAIVEKGRGTQLSVVAIRVVPMCWACDVDEIRRWQANRPNPLMPAEMPTFERTETEGP